MFTYKYIVTQTVYEKTKNCPKSPDLGRLGHDSKMSFILDGQKNSIEIRMSDQAPISITLCSTIKNGTRQSDISVSTLSSFLI